MSDTIAALVTVKAKFEYCPNRTQPYHLYWRGWLITGKTLSEAGNSLRQALEKDLEDA